MLLKFNHIWQVDIHQLLQLYAESLMKDYSGDEDAFLEDLRVYFSEADTILAVWEENGQYLSSLRFEPYEDGFLISCLETNSQVRRQGYASRLVNELLSDVCRPVYVHVEKKNRASLGFHEKLGFRVFKDLAVYVDGSVYHSSCTMKKN